MPGGFCVSTGDFINIAPGADYEKRLEDAILDLDLHTNNEDLVCIVETARMSLSPIECDEAEAEEMYGITLRSSADEEKILHEISNDGSIRVSFGIDMALYNFLIRTFQYINFKHPIIDIIDDEALKIHKTENWMTASVSRSSLFVVAYKGNKLQLVNCYETSAAQNMTYHILNTWTQLNFDVLDDTLYIIGDKHECSELKSIVSTFIKLCV